MTSNQDKLHDKLDELASAAKNSMAKTVDIVVDAANVMTGKVAQHAHDAGARMRRAGDKLEKLAE